MKLLIQKRREFNLETHFAFVDYEKAFDEVKRQKLFNILKEKNIPNILLKNILKIYTNNKIRIKINNNITEERVINRGVRKDCSLSPALFNTYINEIIKQWNEKYTTGIKISNDTKLNTILFADDQFVIANSEDNLQRGLHALHQTVQTFGTEISHQKNQNHSF
jgi:hypothetical protein